MGQFFKSVKFKIILCIAGFFLGIALFSITKGGKTPMLSEGVGTIFNPVRQFSNAISDKVSLVIDLFLDSEKYVEENRQLREKISELNDRLIEYEEMKDEIGSLREFIGIKEENEDYKYSPPCTVISRSVNDPYGSFVIDKGTKHGISLYDPVVAAEGLVGVITEVADTYSTVRTIFSPEMSVGGLCVESRDTGIVEGSLTYAEKNQCKMMYINMENKIKAGDLIITSGTSGQFPQGCKIGNVVETGVEDSGLTSYAIIEPMVNPKNVTNVMVIIDFENDKREITEGNVGVAIPTEPETEPTTEAATNAETEPNVDDGDYDAPADEPVPQNNTPEPVEPDPVEPEPQTEPEPAPEPTEPVPVIGGQEPENGGDSNAE
ncbi:MAG: rod shape-determining protein MreC [Clostridium sp.]|nr:rod shape-determining protein MreC [Clostridium sp.]MCM1547988.1 rod shape-determining protein MreC [Ruminococcus sp.]